RYSVTMREVVSFDKIFFFSSRRRHTRSKRDWSSDVCSSDLAVLSHTVRCIGGLSSRQLGADTAGHTTTHRPLQYLPADCWHLYAVSRAATGTRNTYPAVRNHLARCFVGYCFTAVLDLGTTVGLCSDLCGP